MIDTCCVLMSVRCGCCRPFFLMLMLCVRVVVCCVLLVFCCVFCVVCLLFAVCFSLFVLSFDACGLWLVDKCCVLVNVC